MRNWILTLAAGLMLLGLARPVFAIDADVKAELDKMKKELDDARRERAANAKELEDLRKERASSKPVGPSSVDKAVENKYGPNASVTTKTGKLTIGGLVQVWYYSIQNDNLGFFGRQGNKAVLANGDTNEGKDNDSFSIRRTELKFTMDVHENVTAVVMIDPAAAANAGRPSFNTNLGTSLRSPTVAAPDVAANAATDRLQDAYINFHGIVPHHDWQIGQFKPFIGYEGITSSANLDFVERSMIGQLGDARDLGMTTHGTWWDERFQYWVGAFNTPSSFLAPANQNRTDNNDDKSFSYRVLVRPVWKDETWGNLELGMSSQWNHLFESGSEGGTDGLNLEETGDIRHYAWANYAPGGPVKGWWLKGEYAWIKGRLASNRWLTRAIDGTLMWVDAGAAQLNPRAFDTHGWYVSTGYKISDTPFKDDVPSWLKPVEFAFRYETYGNIQVATLVGGGAANSLVRQNRSNLRHEVWYTDIYTAGINYYIKGHNAKVQVNYNWVNEPSGSHDGTTPPRQIRSVRNDNLMVNFQVAW